MGNPLAPICFFLVLIASAVLGFFVHRYLYNKLKRKWLALLISLPGIIPLAFILSGIGLLFIPRVGQAPVGLGEALGIGIGLAVFLMIFITAGLSSYLITIVIAAMYYWIKKK